MRKLDKNWNSIPSTKYKKWLQELRTKREVRNGDYRYYYDDVVMALYKCQLGVCAYTEMFICIPELYDDQNWINGRFKVPNEAEFQRLDHLGELDHFDSNNKDVEYWNWDNLFMIHAKINNIKSHHNAPSYLKPDSANYEPEKYFDYDNATNRFIPNTDIDDQNIINEIQYAIDHVFCMNHGVVKNDRRDYINLVRSKKERGEQVYITRFFTAINWTFGSNNSII